MGMVQTQPAVPLFSATVSAGFPSPADDYIDRRLDLHELVVRHPAATFFVRVAGSSMTGAGIHDGDVLVVDRSLEPAHNRVVVAALDGELTVKRLRRKNGRAWLVPENDAYPAVELDGQQEVQVWGVVTHVVHAL